MSAEPAGTSAAADTASDETARHLHPVPEPAAEPASPQRTPDTGEQESVPESSGAASRVDVAALLAWGKSTFSPQSGVWSSRPLAPDEVLDRARRGSQVAESGPLRAVSTWDGYAAAIVKIGLRGADWLADHPARRVVATLLLIAALAYPPTRVAIGYALTPIAALADLLT